MNNHSSAISRRRALVGLGAVAGAAALGSCAPGTESEQPPGEGAETGAGPSYPDHIPMLAAPPDIEAAHELGYPGYLTFPTDPVRAVEEKPLAGETITSAAQLQAPAPAPMANNSWWQAINDTIGGTLEMDAAPGADYVAKLATLMTGDQLPDLVQIPNGLPNRADALQARFTELGEYLGGDKIAEFTQLANLTEPAWRSATYHGGIYGIPMPLGFVSSRVITREDVIKSMGYSSAEVASADDFFQLCTDITDTRSNRWALGDATSLNSYIAEMFGVPQEWRMDGGSLQRDIETDEYVEALQFLTRLWSDGLIHPDAFGTINRTELFQGGRVLIIPSGGAGMVTTYNLFADAVPDLEMGMPVAPKADGSGQANKRLGSGVYTLSAIPNTVEPDRVRMLLHVLNTLGAGFGTVEYLAVQFGAEGETWAWDDETGSPKATAKAQGEKLPVNYLPGSMAGGYYSAGYPEIVETAMAYEKQIFETEPVSDPTNGLYSPTEANERTTLRTIVNDAFGAVVQGRREISEWPEVVAEWRNTGGDKVRAELEEAAAEVAG